MLADSAQNYRVHPSGSLEFSNVRVEDSGAYECIATNEVGKTTKTMELKVQGDYMSTNLSMLL